jgi:hypothetical protein
LRYQKIRKLTILSFLGRYSWQNEGKARIPPGGAPSDAARLLKLRGELFKRHGEFRPLKGGGIKER